MANDSHDSLIAAAIAGDRDAVAKLLEEHGEALRRRVQSKIAKRFQSVLDVDDVVQVTFLEVFLRIGRFENRGVGSFQAWLRRIADNNLIDAIRSLEAAKQMPPEKRITFQNGGESSAALLDVIGFTTGTPSRQAVATETHALLRQAVSQLPRDYAQVLTLYDLEGVPMDDVAKKLGRSAGAVYMLRARALDYLRESWGGQSTP